jgi:hypothetical protein
MESCSALFLFVLSGFFLQVIFSGTMVVAVCSNPRSERCAHLEPDAGETTVIPSPPYIRVVSFDSW